MGISDYYGTGGGYYSSPANRRRALAETLGLNETEAEYEKLLSEVGELPAQEPEPGFFERILRYSPINILTGNKVKLEDWVTGGAASTIKDAAVEEGALGRIFDLLQRGQYSVAAAAKAQIDRDNDLPGIPGLFPGAVGTLFDAADLVRDVIPSQVYESPLTMLFGKGGRDFARQLQESQETVSNAVEAISGEAAVGDVLQIIKGEEGPTALGEAFRGVTGKNKASFQDILEGEGITNPLVSAPQGFALDILLDPTTYVTTGVVKGSSASKYLGDFAKYLQAKDDWIRKGSRKLHDASERVTVPVKDLVTEKFYPGLRGDVGSANQFTADIVFHPKTLDESGAGFQTVQKNLDELTELQSPIENIETWSKLKNYGSDEIPFSAVRAMDIPTEDILEGQTKGIWEIQFDTPVDVPSRALFGGTEEAVSQAPISNAKLWDDIARLSKGSGNKLTSYEDLMDAGYSPDEITQAFREIQERGIGALMEFDDPIAARQTARRRGWIPPSDIKPGPGTGHGIRGTLIPENRLRPREAAPTTTTTRDVLKINRKATVDVEEPVPPTETIGRTVETAQGTVIAPDLRDSLPSRYVDWADPTGDRLLSEHYDKLIKDLTKGTRHYVDDASPQISSGVHPVPTRASGKKSLVDSPFHYDPGKPPLQLPPVGRLPKSPIPPAPANAGYFRAGFGPVDFIRSQKAYEVGRAFLRPLMYNQKGEARLLNRAFRLQATLPEGTDQILRMKQSNQAAEQSERIMGLRYIFDGVNLSEPQRRELFDAIENGVNLGDRPLNKTIAGYKTLEDIKATIMAAYHEMALAEWDRGLLDVNPFDLDNNYQYLSRRIFPKKTKANRVEHSSKLIEKGLVKNEDLDAVELLLDRIGKHSRIMAHRDFQQELVLRHGVPMSKANKDLIKKYDFKKVDANWAPPDTYLPPEIHRAWQWFDRHLVNDEAGAELLRHWDKVLSEWKFWVTQINPGFHMRNLWADVIMNAQDGVFSVFPYRKARKILQDVYPSSKQPWLAGRGHILGAKGQVPEYTRRLMGDAGLPIEELPLEKGTRITINGQPVDSKHLWELYKRAGGKSGYISSDIRRAINTYGIHGNSLRRQLGKVKAGAGEFGDLREDWVRLSHFVHALEDEGKNIRLFDNKGAFTYSQAAKDVVERAGQRVRKWNIDYGALSKFERNVTRRAIPFYSFMRFNIPRQMEMLLTKPGFMAVYPKQTNLVNGLLNTDDAEDVLVPDWIRASAPYRLQARGQEQKGPVGWLLKNVLGVQPGEQAVLAGDAAPVGSLQILDPLLAGSPTGIVEEGASELVNMMHPAAGALAGLSTGTDPFTGGPTDINTVLRNLVPAGRLGTKTFDEGLSTRDDWFRWLTGIPARRVSEFQQRGEFRRREDKIRDYVDRVIENSAPVDYGKLPPTDNREAFRQLFALQQRRRG